MKIDARNEVGEIESILVTHKLAVDPNNTTGSFAEFRRIACKIDVHTFDRINWDPGGNSCPRGIREIDAVEIVPDLIGA